jgi:hypothetical protein
MGLFGLGKKKKKKDSHKELSNAINPPKNNTSDVNSQVPLPNNSNMNNENAEFNPFNQQEKNSAKQPQQTNNLNVPPTPQQTNNKEFNPFNQPQQNNKEINPFEQQNMPEQNRNNENLNPFNQPQPQQTNNLNVPPTPQQNNINEKEENKSSENDTSINKENKKKGKSVEFLDEVLDKEEYLNSEEVEKALKEKKENKKKDSIIKKKEKEEMRESKNKNNEEFEIDDKILSPDDIIVNKKLNLPDFGSPNKVQDIKKIEGDLFVKSTLFSKMLEDNVSLKQEIKEYDSLSNSIKSKINSQAKISDQVKTNFEKLQDNLMKIENILFEKR